MKCTVCKSKKKRVIYRSFGMTEDNSEIDLTDIVWVCALCEEVYRFEGLLKKVVCYNKI